MLHVSEMAPLPVFYLNLARRTDRRQFMEEQFAQLGIRAERIESSTVADVTDADLKPFTDPDYPWSITPVEVACRLSHQRAWQLLLERGLSAALILEDDVVLGEALPRILESTDIQRVGEGVLRLECSNRRVRLGRARATVLDRFQVKRMLSSDSGTAAYIIGAEMARRCLADRRLAALSVDGYLFMRRGRVVLSGPFMQLDPAPCVQLEFYAPGEAKLRASDLTQARLSAPPRPKSWRARWLRSVTDLSYSVRAAWLTLKEHKGSIPPRRQVAFDLLP